MPSLHLLRKGVKGLGNVALESNRHWIVRIDMGGIAMNVQDLLVAIGIDCHGIKFLQIIANADDDICLVEAKIDVIMAHKAYRAQGVRMLIGKDSLTHERGGHGDLELLRAADECVARLIAHGTMPRQDDGSLGRPQDVHRSRDLARPKEKNRARH